MRFSLLAVGVLLLFSVCCPSSMATEPFGLPELTVPDALGMNIHFTHPRPGEMQMLADSGARWIRMDFGWGGTEREKGKYDFSAFEHLLNTMRPHGLRALFILDYSNRHYDNGLSPSSDEGRKAFARWAAAAVKKFQGRGILWEMYNEPNIHFWKPEPDVKQYVKLAVEVGKALREVAPNEMYIGPATSQIDLPFLEECFKAGLLDYWCAVSVHPYRHQKGPETAADEYAQLRRLIDQYAPEGKKIPILSAEWGFSAAWQNHDEVKQGKLLPRQWLTNLANEVPLSIWYDWHDDGRDPKEPEHHFGMVAHPYHEGRDPVYDAKPAYLAAQTLTTQLDGFRYGLRLSVGSDDDYVLLFTRGDELRLAAWTTSNEPHAVVIPASPGQFAVTGHTGEKQPALVADVRGLALTLTDAPQYLVPEGANDLLRVAAAWQSMPWAVCLPAGGGVSFPLSIRNPLSQPIRVATGDGPTVELKPGETTTLASTFDLLRSSEPTEVRLVCRVEGLGELVQTVRAVATNPLHVCPGPPSGQKLIVRVENPAGDGFAGRLRLTDVAGLSPETDSAAIRFSAGETQKDVVFGLQNQAEAEYRFGIQIEDEQGKLLLSVPTCRMCLVDDFSRYTPETVANHFKMAVHGDDQVVSSQSIGVASTPAGAPFAATTTLKISYTMAAGWKYIWVVPSQDTPRRLQGRPKAVATWVYSDGSGNHLRMRFRDATGQTFQPTGGVMKEPGWQYVVFSLTGEKTGHWGGADDGVVHYPIRWDTPLLIDSTKQPTGPREVFVGPPVLID